MNKLKRAIAVLLCSALLFSGCSNDTGTESAETAAETTAETTAEISADVSAEEETEEVTEEEKEIIAEIMGEETDAESSADSSAEDSEEEKAEESADVPEEDESGEAEESEKAEDKEDEKETLPDSAEKVEEPESNITAYSSDEDGEAEKDAAAGKAKSETTAKTDSTTSTTETKAETAEESTEPERIYSYLNGKTVTEEVRNKRPVAIMLNNIKKCLPQASLCDGDIYYECAAEGGITRIMMICEDYESLGTVGSIRSSRDYFVDFLANHDAIYVHAGGSEQAYAKINWRGINNLDGVNMYIPNMFWRDQTRMNTMGYEHSLMTSGEGIVSGIKYKNYRTELSESQVPLFEFYDEETDNTLVGSPATHVHMKSTSIQTVDFVYNETTGEYLRYQYNGMAHVDANTGEQLSVKNVLILFTDISLIPGDTAGRLQVGTVGSGQGYYITNGKRKVVNWSREGKTDTLHLEYRNGDKLILNCGKTFICVVDNSVAKTIDFEYSW